MPKQVTKLTVLAASPGDVRTERDRLGQVVEELNRNVAGQLGFVLQLERWETDVRPGIGSDLQAVVGTQLTPPDAVLAIFWTRLGTPTPRAGSGTVEEVEAAIARRQAGETVEIMVYFSQQPPSLSDVDPDQLARLLAFKRELPARGVLARDYASPAEFERLAHRHLTGWLQALAAGDLQPASPEVVEAVMTADDGTSVAARLAEGTFAVEVDVRHADRLVRLAKEIRAALSGAPFAPMAIETVVVCLNELMANVRKHTGSHIARIEIDIELEFSKGVSIDVYSSGSPVDVDAVLERNLQAMATDGDREHGLLAIARLTGNLHAAEKYRDEGLAGVGCYVHDPEPRYEQHFRARAGLAAVSIEADEYYRLWIGDRFRYGRQTAFILKFAVEHGLTSVLRDYFGDLRADGRALAIEYAGSMTTTTRYDVVVDEPHDKFPDVRSRDPLRAAVEAAFPTAFEDRSVLMLSHDVDYWSELQDWSALWGIKHYASLAEVPGVGKADTTAE